MTLGPLRFTNALGGTADFIYPGPTIDMQSPAAAGAVDGSTYLIYAQSFDMSQWEIATGIYTLSSGTFARTTVKANSLGTAAKINFSNPPQVFILDSSAGAGPRERLTADRTYYVRSDGNDSNTGLANTSGGAFLTWQRAVDVVMALDFGTHNTSILYGQTGSAHTFAKGFTVSGAIVGSGQLSITGDTTTPTNCVIAEASSGWAISAKNLAAVNIGGFSVAGKNGFPAMFATSGAVISVTGAMDYAATDVSGTGAHQMATAGGKILGQGLNYTISGGGAYHIYTQDAGSEVANLGSTTTFAADAAFTTYANAINLAQILSGSTINLGGHTITGKRFNVTNNAAILTGTGNVNYFPGNSAGTGTNSGTSPFGVYT